MAGHIFVEEFLALLLPHTTMNPRFRFQIREDTFDRNFKAVTGKTPQEWKIVGF